MPLKVLTKPVRALALYETLSSASVRRGPAVLPDPRRFARETLAQDSLAILLVEDNEPNRYVLRLMIEELGLKADEAGSGLEAVECARKREYDVILMDVQMSGLDGLDATRRIRGEQHGKPPIIIALTAGVMVNDEPRCREAGMDGYLPKPVRLDTLAAILRPLALAKIPT